MRIKTISYILLAAVLTGCADRLDLNPISSKSVGSFYKTPEDMEQAIVGCYTGLRAASVSDNFSYMMSDGRSDDCWQEVAYDDGAFSRFTEYSGTPTLNSAWSRLYNTITRCNYIIGSIDDVKFADTLSRNRILGEAMFIRALSHFDLLRYFGDVPVVEKVLTIDESYKLRRSGAADVYKSIIRDLTSASEMLPEGKPSDHPNRATAAAAYGFLGKVYVYKAGYPLWDKDSWPLAKDALKKCLDIVGEGGWLSNYADIFAYRNENKDQAVFSLGFLANASGQGNIYPTRNAPNDMFNGTGEYEIPYGGSPYRLFLSDAIVKSIFPDDRDLRKKYAIQPKWKDKSGAMVEEPIDRKYRDGVVARSGDWDIDYILLRYTDVYMLYAEALYHTGNPSEALEIINKVRERAGIDALSASDIDTEDKFTDVILRERRSEFCFENQRWFDLVRTDRALEVMKKFLENYDISSNFRDRSQYHYPIPLRETEISGIK